MTNGYGDRRGDVEDVVRGGNVEDVVRGGDVEDVVRGGKCDFVCWRNAWMLKAL